MPFNKYFSRGEECGNKNYNYNVNFYTEVQYKVVYLNCVPQLRYTTSTEVEYQEN